MGTTRMAALQRKWRRASVRLLLTRRSSRPPSASSSWSKTLAKTLAVFGLHSVEYDTITCVADAQEHPTLTSVTPLFTFPPFSLLLFLRSGLPLSRSCLLCSLSSSLLAYCNSGHASNWMPPCPSPILICLRNLVSKTGGTWCLLLHVRPISICAYHQLLYSPNSLSMTTSLRSSLVGPYGMRLNTAV